MSSATSCLSPQDYIPITIRALSVLRAGFQMFVTENPLSWSYLQGRWNEQADLEGPYYIIGAPNRPELSEGKSIVASHTSLKAFLPFLLSISIKDPKGNPVPGITIDWWQANTDGVYSFDSYDLRGKMKTDENGNIDVLTVLPGAYGLQSAKRAGHVHLIISDETGRWQSVTTQQYVCAGNNSDSMKTDFLNFLRAPRVRNMLRVWSTTPGSNGEVPMDFPGLPSDDLATRQNVEWWNKVLCEIDPELKVVAGARCEITLQPRL